MGKAGPGASTSRPGKSPRCQPTGPCCSLPALKAQVPHAPAPASVPAPSFQKLILWLRVVQKKKEGASQLWPHHGYSGGRRMPAPFCIRKKFEWVLQ